MNPQEAKSKWTAKHPYPAWPFGTVNPKELKKLKPNHQKPVYPEAPF